MHAGLQALLPTQIPVREAMLAPCSSDPAPTINFSNSGASLPPVSQFRYNLASSTICCPGPHPLLSSSLAPLSLALPSFGLLWPHSLHLLSPSPPHSLMARSSLVVMFSLLLSLFWTPSEASDCFFPHIYNKALPLVHTLEY